MNEQQLQAKIIKYITAKGGYVVKVITATKAGVPDIVCCYKGRFYGIEVKVGRNKASALQLANLRQIAEAGGIGILAYSLDDVVKLLSSNQQ
jgi:Holliday junction resolvase